MLEVHDPAATAEYIVFAHVGMRLAEVALRATWRRIRTGLAGRLARLVAEAEDGEEAARDCAA